MLNHIVIPASKSISQRAIAAALLSDGISTIFNAGTDNDTLAAIGMAKDLGASIDRSRNGLIVKGGLSFVNKHLNSRESGLSLRMFSAIATLSGQEIDITGEGTLAKRPVAMIKDALEQGDVSVATNGGLLPVSLSGKLRGGVFNIDGSITSQMLTGLLMALPLAEQDSTIHVENLKSKPYIDITLDLLGAFGIVVENIDYRKFFISGNQRYRATDYRVEGDWSSAAFWFVAGAIAGDVSIEGLNPNTKQADIKILDALKQAGVTACFANGAYCVHKSKIQAFDFDATDCPDLIPPLCLLAACAKGKSSLSGASRLAFKESNRAIVLQQEFAKQGIAITVADDVITIEGGCIAGGQIDSHNDHRIAMTFMVASLVAESKITISNLECIDKSYPGFHEQFERYLRNQKATF